MFVLLCATCVCVRVCFQSFRPPLKSKSHLEFSPGVKLSVRIKCSDGGGRRGGCKLRNSDLSIEETLF